jgi:hypothetical protein
MAHARVSNVKLSGQNSVPRKAPVRHLLILVSPITMMRRPPVRAYRFEYRPKLRSSSNDAVLRYKAQVTSVGGE